MKQRILGIVAALLCTVTLFSTGIVPAMAYAPTSGEGDISVRAEEVCWFYRNNNGVEEMRLWSITRQLWLTDWIPVPDDWLNP